MLYPGFHHRNSKGHTVIISVGNVKGGTGKSCLAQNLSVYMTLRMELKILLVDADPQGTTDDWIKERRKSGLYQDIRSTKMTGDIREDLIETARAYDAIVVDLGGHDTETLRSAMAASSSVLVPFRPKRRDLKVAPQMASLARLVKAANPGCSIRAVINQSRSLPHQLARAVSAKALCKKLDLAPLSIILHDRNIYDDAEEEGGSIFESGDKKNADKAVQEFTALAQELLQAQEGATR